MIFNSIGNEMKNEIEINGEIYGAGMAKIILTFESMGYEILTICKDNANGPDMHVRKGNVVLRVEIKKARQSNRSMAVHPIEHSRKNDDLVAVYFPSGYVFIEPMQDYLMNCSDSGSRSFFGIY